MGPPRVTLKKQKWFSSVPPCTMMQTQNLRYLTGVLPSLQVASTDHVSSHLERMRIKTRVITQERSLQALQLIRAPRWKREKYASVCRNGLKAAFSHWVGGGGVVSSQPSSAPSRGPAHPPVGGALWRQCSRAYKAVQSGRAAQFDQHHACGGCNLGVGWTWKTWCAALSHQIPGCRALPARLPHLT